MRLQTTPTYKTWFLCLFSHGIWVIYAEAFNYKIGNAAHSRISEATLWENDTEMEKLEATNTEAKQNDRLTPLITAETGTREVVMQLPRNLLQSQKREEMRVVWFLPVQKSVIPLCTFDMQTMQTYLTFNSGFCTSVELDGFLTDLLSFVQLIESFK